MTPVGTRVTAILDAQDGVVRTFGDGVYAGDFRIAPDAAGFNFGQQGPRIDLDDGRSVWGCECWWGPCGDLRQRFPEPDWRWEQVDIDEVRASQVEESNGQ